MLEIRDKEILRNTDRETYRTPLEIWREVTSTIKNEGSLGYIHKRVLELAEQKFLERMERPLTDDEKRYKDANVTSIAVYRLSEKGFDSLKDEKSLNPSSDSAQNGNI